MPQKKPKRKPLIPTRPRESDGTLYGTKSGTHIWFSPRRDPNLAREVTKGWLLPDFVARYPDIVPPHPGTEILTKIDLKAAALAK